MKLRKQNSQLKVDMELPYFISGLVIAGIFCICFCCYRVTQGPCPSWTQPPTMRRQEQENFDNQTNQSNNQVFVVESGNFLKVI